MLQQRPHHSHQVVGRRHQGDLPPLRIITPYPLEVRPDRRRAPRGARDIPRRLEVRDPHGFGRQRCRRSHAQGEPCVLSSGDRTRRSNRSRGLPEGTRPPVAIARLPNFEIAIPEPTGHEIADSPVPSRGVAESEAEVPWGPPRRVRSQAGREWSRAWRRPIVRPAPRRAPGQIRVRVRARAGRRGVCGGHGTSRC